MSLAPNGSLAAVCTKVAAENWQLVVWETVSGKIINEIATKATALLFAPDGSWLAAGDEEGHVTIRSLPGGNELADLPNGRAQIHCLAYSADRHRRAPGKVPRKQALSGLLAVGDAGGIVTVWDLTTKLPKPPCRGSAHDIFCVALSPDGTTVASGGRYDARLWDTATGRLLLRLPAANFVQSVAFSPDGQNVAIAVSDYDPKKNRVDIWHLEAGRGLLALRGLAGQVSNVIFSSRGDLLAAMTMDWQVAIWRLPDGQLLHVLEAPKGFDAGNAGLAFSADSRHFAFCAGSEAKLWDVDSGHEQRSWKLPPAFADTLAFANGGNQLLLIRYETEDMKLAPGAGAHPDQHPRVCRVRDLLASDYRKPLHEIRDFNRHIWAILAPADGSFFVVEGRTGSAEQPRHTLKVFDSLTGKVIWLQPPDQFPFYLSSGWSLDPSGKLFLVGSRTKDSLPANLLEMPGAKPIDNWEEFSTGLGPDARYFARPVYPGIGFFKGGSTSPLVRLAIDSPPSSFGTPFNRAGTHVAWGNADGTVVLCDIEEVRRRLGGLKLAW
jgi:WD40 repeat protein